MSVSPTYYVCFLNNYNNYFNRIIKGFATLAEYQAEVGTGNFYLYSQPVNYAPNDNVSTELIMNDCPFEPDYLLILNSDLEIVARWFVVHSTITRNGQRKFELRRDLIFDFKENLKESPMFVQKGFLRDNDSFIVNDEGMNFNQVKTGETFLKDKTNSAWLVGYISKNAASSDVSVQVPDTDIKFISISDLASDSGINESVLVSLLNFDGANNNPAFFTKQIEFRYLTTEIMGQLGGGLLRNQVFMNPELTSGSTAFQGGYSLIVNQRIWSMQVLFPGNTTNYFKTSIINNKATVLAQLPTIFARPYLTEKQYNKLYAHNGEIIRYNGLYYKLSFSVENSSLKDTYGYFNYSQYTSLNTVVNQTTTALQAATSLYSDVVQYPQGQMQVNPTSIKVFIQMEYISDESGVIPSVQTKVSSSRNVVANQAFDMFCIPYGPALFKSDTGDQEAIGEYALSIGAQIALELDAQLYDLQLLPYCPLVENFDNNNQIDLTALTQNSDFNYIDKTQSRVRITETLPGNVAPDPDNPGYYYCGLALTIPNTNLADILDSGYSIEGPDASNVYSTSLTAAQVGSDVVLSFWGACQYEQADDFRVSIWYEITGTSHVSFILWARQASFSTQLDYQLNLKNSMKIESQCNFYRLTSPNYQGSFEFNVAKNGGSVAFFVAECTYKPYTPYIKVAPQFSFLYGANYGDQRGLVCGGDFSLPRFNSAWESYQLNNKNYQNIFNRDIQNLTLEQSLQMRQQLISGAMGIASAGIIGGGVGAKAGGVYGAIAGAAIGTIGSAVGFGVDIDILATQQKENKSLAIDKYNYQLGNIKALPYTLTKVGAFDINSKIWPFLEYYTCTDEEKEALESKITYESMTVMRIDLIGDYLEAFAEKHYLKGELIRNEKIADDNHILEAINYEFAKGVYC